MGDHEHDEESHGYCNLCGDPVTGSDLFCAGCGAAVEQDREAPEAEAEGS